MQDLKDIRNESALNETSPAETQPPDTSFRKFKRYVGLAAAIGFLIAAFFQVDDRRLGRRASVLDKTVVNAIVWQGERVQFSSRVDYAALACESSKRELALKYKPSMQDAQNVFNICDSTNVFWPAGGALARLMAADPLHLDKVGEYMKLRDEAKAAQRVDGAYNSPMPTPEMIELGNELTRTVEKVRQADIRWLERMNLLAHLAALALGILGIAWRERVGGLLLSPFIAFSRGGAKAAKGIHERV